MQATMANSLPRSCVLETKLDREILFAFKGLMFSKLRPMMTDEEIIDASDEKQPALDKMRAVTCHGCNVHECSLNQRNKPSDSLSDLMKGAYSDRIKKGHELLARILPEAKKSMLEQKGVRVSLYSWPSRKNPRLIFLFVRDTQEQDVRCDIGTRRLQVNESVEQLISIEQLTQRVESVIEMFN